MHDNNSLLGLDRSQLLHPLHHVSGHDSALIFTHREGIRLTAPNGRRYIDGPGLWNVLIGQGNEELADVAQRQMKEGPETVAAFIAEPVQGAGGVIVPGDILIIVPPLIITAAEVDKIMQIVEEVLTEAAGR